VQSLESPFQIENANKEGENNNKAFQHLMNWDMSVNESNRI
jgi:hypothetical protein